VLIAGNALEIILLQRGEKSRARTLKKYNIGQSAAKMLKRICARHKVQRLGEIRRQQVLSKSTIGKPKDIVPSRGETPRDLMETIRS